jgi:hypothetical protein
MHLSSCYRVNLFHGKHISRALRAPNSFIVNIPDRCHLFLKLSNSQDPEESRINMHLQPCGSISNLYAFRCFCHSRGNFATNGHNCHDRSRSLGAAMAPLLSRRRRGVIPANTGGDSSKHTTLNVTLGKNDLSAANDSDATAAPPPTQVVPAVIP